MSVIFPKCERAMAGRVPPEELVRSCLEAVGIISIHSSVLVWKPARGGSAPRMARKAGCVIPRYSMDIILTASLQCSPK